MAAQLVACEIGQHVRCGRSGPGHVRAGAAAPPRTGRPARTPRLSHDDRQAPAAEPSPAPLGGRGVPRSAGADAGSGGPVRRASPDHPVNAARN
ncbi:hypothetical protein G6F23_015807 [Rhizopus arrhizus]|nr:hypothetical protein G6F23_015807 [Rhizopus arrhizus]